MRTSSVRLQRWARTSVASLLSVALLGVGVPAAEAAVAFQESEESETPEPLDIGSARQVVLRPVDETTFEFDGKVLSGEVEIRAEADGLVLVEELDPETYLLGIQEVPYAWPRDALAAQAVAARTYLAWTLDRGRAGAGSTYGFDICATTACQVYNGVGLVDTGGGSRWASAVRATAGEVLLFEGNPAQALYSSSTGGRTRAVEDVFTGSAPKPYLTAVESPAEETIFTEWSVDITLDDLVEILRAADALPPGRFRGVRVELTDDGSGPWQVIVSSDQGAKSYSTWQFRTLMNRFGPRLFPDQLPADYNEERRYPNVVLSPTYTIGTSVSYPDSFTSGYIDVERIYSISGNGWGHLVGMSQFGAKALADQGAAYEEILSYFYTGLEPERTDDILPEKVSVGLAWAAEEITIVASGGFEVLLDGDLVEQVALGTWTFADDRGRVSVGPPEGFGLPPTWKHLPRVVVVPPGFLISLEGELVAPAEVRVVVDGEPGPWQILRSGESVLVPAFLVSGSGPQEVQIEARNAAGVSTSSVIVWVQRLLQDAGPR